MRLTDTYLRSVQPKDKPYRVFEKGFTRGFGVQVTPRGSVAFFLCYQESGKTRYKTLGTYPTLSLNQARIEAKKFRQQVDAGTVAVKQTGTLQHLIDYYLAEKEKEGKKTIKGMRRILEKDVIEVLGAGKEAGRVTAQDVRQVLYNCIERGAEAHSNRVRSLLRSAFQYGIRHDYDPRSLGGVMLFHLTVNPVDLVPRGRGFESVGERVLTLEELATIWNYKGPVLSLQHVSVFKLIILFSGLRPSEVTQAVKAEIDFENGLWSLPPARTKNGRWHVLPLTDYIRNLLQTLYAYYPDSPCLFPSRFDSSKPEHPTSFGHAIVRTVAKLDMEVWTPRDLRRTCKTWAGYAGLSKDIRDRLLNHALTDVSAKHYDRHLYLREKLEALETWEKFLLEELEQD
jgi:integrase